MGDGESRIVALAGGVGGAKLAYGLYRVLNEQLMVVVNTGASTTRSSVGGWMARPIAPWR